ncbi:MAG: UDP-N-acetylmuramoylalanyl-D-glutamyl-2,6-diaminopimelate--D-alanyl-D-alanine ligase [Rhodobiaceae bacterium]|nr:UDP-N-acetylmuramoylalanyl-D-glutamyl-2,6-diaminopimelate--D-alanyl-D-alanine ligase [Rhodobiaceae bacterium]MCC0040854.1 UDP-N-acetylmuramoylalanyl-D-glutamyl-2,6-diaminopimelate--D-alanyl-D-alanine ligase [Rhodobiaceae bacterium]
MSDTPLWTANAFAAAAGGSVQGQLRDVTGISIDTRTLERGDAFFAIRGERLDGHDYVRAALEKGAACAVVEASRAGEFADAGCVIGVDDVLNALEGVGRAARARSQAKIIGVTGSVGKTGTKEALRLVLAPCGEVYASAASHNNHWGVPLSLSRFPQSAAFGIFEMGMNAPGEIGPLSRMVRPQVSIITTVEPVHIEFFKSVEQIADAKAEIFEGTEPGGVAVLNADNAQFSRLRDSARAAGLKTVSFGAEESADARLVDCVCEAEFSAVTADVLGDLVTYKIGAPGRHLVQNSLAVMAAVKLTGGDLARAALAYAGLHAPKGRGARMRIGDPDCPALLIDESYNANPASMRAAIGNLALAPVVAAGRRIAVLGDMLELGEGSRQMHADVAGAVEEARLDLVFACGPNMAALFDALPPERQAGYAEVAEGLTDSVLAAVRPGDAVMVKGSLGSRMGQIVEALKARYGVLEDAS